VLLEIFESIGCFLRPFEFVLFLEQLKEKKASFSGFASIPLWLTMKPSSFPNGTSKTHLVGFNFHLKLHKLLKVSSRSGIKESNSFVFTTTLST